MRGWMLSDRLKLKDDKTEFIIMGTRQQLAKVNIESMRVGDSTTTPASDVNNLGTWFDRQLRWTHTLITVVKPLFFHLYNIRRFRKFPQS